jgi:hypothetical protein
MKTGVQKKALAIPRVPIGNWWGDGPKPQVGTPEFERLLELFRANQDSTFAARLHTAEIEKLKNDTFEFLASRGWLPQQDLTMARGGIALDSVVAANEDRDAHVRWTSLLSALEVHDLLQSASRQQVRALRLAWEYGLAVAEEQIYHFRSINAGRKPKKASIFRGLDAANRRWTTRNPGSTIRPTAAQLKDLYTGPDYGSAANFRNYVSEWRKLQVIDNSESGLQKNNRSEASTSDRARAPN